MICIKVKHNHCSCSEIREEVALQDINKRGVVKNEEIIGFDCSHCGLKQAIDKNKVLKVKSEGTQCSLF